MFKLHDNAQAVRGRKREGWDGDTKPKEGSSTPKSMATSSSMDWEHKSVHMALHELTKAKDLLGRNIQVFTRQPKVLWSLHFFQCFYSSSSSCTGKLCPNAVISITPEAAALSNTVTHTYIA